MEGDIAATYALVHRFLKQQSQHKAAEAVKKAARPIVVLRDDIEQNGPSLEDIVKAWKTMADTNSGDTGCMYAPCFCRCGQIPALASSEDAGSDDSTSGSDSSSEESEDASGSGSKSDDTSQNDDGSDDSDGGTIPKKPPPRPIERDTSVTLSSENTQEVAAQATNIPRKSTEDVHKAPKNENKNTQSDSADSDSSESDSSSQSSDSDGSDAESSSGDSSSSSGSDSSDKCKEDAGVQPPKNETKATATSSSESDDETDLESEQGEDTHVAKRRKTSENDTARVVTGSQDIARAPQQKEKLPPKVRERFQRVKIQNMAPESLLNNGYEARGGKVNDYGERAHRDLVTTRGAGFRKEKNKKKRGSYRGGEITMENHSIRFDF